MYALSLNTDNRILSACIVLPSTPESMPRVETLPDGNITDWLYIAGGYVYDPLPVPDDAVYADRNYEAGDLATLKGTLYEFLINVARGCKIDNNNAVPTTMEAQLEKMKGAPT